MDTPTEHPAQFQPSAYSPPSPPVQPKKGMSAGTKWAIGIGAGLLLLILVSCAVSLALMTSSDSGIALGDQVAVIHLEGVIQGGSSGSGSPEYMLDQLDQAVADDAVKAILLRIDSPGGTVAASQEIMMGVQRASEVKPVVASVGDICASGGYMVASQCDEIVAAPGSTVGSIGVIMEIPNVEGLLDKVGVTFTTLTQGDLKDAGSPYRSLTETETAMLNDQMSLVYDQFITDVATGRDMDEAEVRKLATGWAWIGSEALDLGLVDSLGNYNDAIDRAAELGGIEGEPTIVTFEPSDPFTEWLNSLIGLKSDLGQFDTDTLRRSGLPR